MAKPVLPTASRSKSANTMETKAGTNSRRRRTRRNNENSDVLISAVISTHLLTSLHQVLQRAEFEAIKEGRVSQAANFGQLRKVLCMDARSMKDASASGVREGDRQKLQRSNIASKVEPAEALKYE